MNLEQEIRNLFGNEPEKNPLFKKLMSELSKGEEKTKKKAERIPIPPCTKYTEVTIIYHCKHCGAVWERTHKLSEGESITTTDINRHIHIIKASTPTKRDSFVSHCDNCKHFIASLERKDLEEKYLSLFGALPWFKV